MEVVANNDWPRDSDGYVICSCGCQKRITVGETVVVGIVNVGVGIIRNAEGWSLYSAYKLDCVELANKSQTLSSHDARRTDLLELSNSNPAELQRLYVWMHDALRCRI